MKARRGRPERQCKSRGEAGRRAPSSAGLIHPVVAGHCVDAERHVLHRAREHADVIQRARQPRDPGARDRAEARLHAPDAAEGRRPHDRAGGLSAERERHAAGRHGRGRARRGAAWRARERVGVAGSVCGAAGKLGGHCLAEDQRARRAQTADDRGIRARPASLVERRAVLGRLVGGIDDVLDGDRNARKQPARAGIVDRPRSHRSLGGVEMAPCPDRRLGRGDAVQRRGTGRRRALSAGSNPGRNLLHARALRQRRRRQFAPVGRRHGLLTCAVQSSFLPAGPWHSAVAWQA